jgi:hypothetical protein
VKTPTTWVAIRIKNKFRYDKFYTKLRCTACATFTWQIKLKQLGATFVVLVSGAKLRNQSAKQNFFCKNYLSNIQFLRLEQLSSLRLPLDWLIAIRDHLTTNFWQELPSLSSERCIQRGSLWFRSPQRNGALANSMWIPSLFSGHGVELHVATISKTSTLSAEYQLLQKPPRDAQPQLESRGQDSAFRQFFGKKMCAAKHGSTGVWGSTESRYCGGRMRFTSQICGYIV